jgi:aminoglycoside 6'-N-acetyltransferase
MAINLRPATSADIPLLEAWDEDPVVAASDPHDDWDWTTEVLGIEGLEQLIAELDGQPIGFVQITDPLRDTTRYWGDPQSGFKAIDIWIGVPEARGKGCGRAMMKLALARCFADPTIDLVLIDPLITNTQAIAFYRRLGFTFLENRWFGEDHCAVHQITRDTFEQGHQL